MRFSLLFKLVTLIAITFVLVVFPLLYISETKLSQFGVYAYTENKKQIEQITNEYLSNIVKERAQTYNELFKRIKSVSSMMLTQAVSVYNNLETLSLIDTPKKLALTWQPENQMFYNPKKEDVTIVYWGDETVSESILKEIKALNFYRPVLLKSKQLLDECIATHMITMSGIGFYHTKNPHAREMVYHLPSPSYFDLRDGEPVTIFTKSNRLIKETQWTNVYKDDVIDGLMITATSPIYDKKGRFRGITGVDFPINNIIKNLTRNDFQYEILNSDNAFAFLQNDEGKIIALPYRFYDLLGIRIDRSQFRNSDDICSLSLENSSIQSIKKLYPIIKNKHQGVIRVDIKGEDYIWAIGYLEEMDWHFVMVVKKKEILESVQKIYMALTSAKKIIWENFLLHSILIAIIATVLIIYVIKLIISPIHHFIKTTRKVAKGNYSKTLDINRTDEIAVLSKSLNSMIEKLSESEKIKKKYADKLKGEVHSRTKELENANHELKQIKSTLEDRIDLKTVQLKKLNTHLIDLGESERKKLSYELHDGVAQMLALSIGKLKNLKDNETYITFDKINEIEQYLIEAVNEVRLLIHQLRPPIIDDFELGAIVDHLVKGYNMNWECNLTYVDESKNLKMLKQEVKLTVYRILNELIVNVLKHSKARNAIIELTNNREAIFLTVEDDGIGFDWNKIQKEKLDAFGLFGISERINSFDGDFTIVSSSGKGTAIKTVIPIQ